MHSELPAHAISPGAALTPSHEQVSCRLGGEVVLLNVRTGTYYSLNPVGARVWELVQERSSLSQIQRALLDELEVDPGQLEGDLQECARALRDAGLIEVCQ